MIKSDGTLESKSDQEKQQQLGTNCNAALDNPIATGERVPSGGPALTSDGGDRSSLDSSASSFARITPHSSSSAIASSSDECIESMDLVCPNKRAINNQPTCGQGKRPAIVGVHVVCDTDLYSPGYSVIRKRSNKVGPDNKSGGGSGACLCQPYGQQKESVERITGDKATLMERDEIEDEVKVIKTSSSQLEQQPANGIKKDNNCNGESKTTSKLRQLLHLDSSSRTKTSDSKFNGQQRSGMTSSNKAISNSGGKQNGFCSGPNNFGSGKYESGDESSPSRLPQTALAGAYYAYSPVVQSASELKSKQSMGSDVSKTSKTQENSSNKSDVSKSNGKKNWLMSKFSMSSNNINNNHKPASNNNQSMDSTSIGGKQGLIADMQKAKPIVSKPESANAEASTNSNVLLGPERKAELINILGADLHDISNKNLNFGRQELVSSLAHHDHTADNISPSGSHLIRPKSAFSATSADLIAAQRSLAAAAAEKVNRDRMVKLCPNGSINNFTSSTDSSQNDELTTSKESILTVKTCDPFWSTVGHVVNHQPIVAQNGINHQSYMIGHQHQLVNHRSGTNSLGMSDSSPSNNGAESDNSIQTTTGSANTDITTSGGIGSCAGVDSNTGRDDSQLTANKDQNASSSPLGILSRILLNNKSFGYKTASSRAVSAAPATSNKDSGPIMDSKKESQFMRTTNGSLSSSSALSSPSSNNHSPSTITSNVVNGTTATTDATIKTSQRKLDQLASRSRCPIVLTKSNGLPSEAEEEDEEVEKEREKEKEKESRNKKKGTPGKEEDKEDSSLKRKNINDCLPGASRDSTGPPPLPAKGVLKMPNSRALTQNSENSNKLAAPNGAMSSILLDSTNGLPRVSSYTQISSALNPCPSFDQPFYGLNYPKSCSKQLCNYHLLNKRNNHNVPAQLQAHYNPYSPTITTSKEGLYNDGRCRGSPCKQLSNGYHLEQAHSQVPEQHLHHMSHHDLRSNATPNATSNSLADLTALSTSAAINYEYYFENLPFIQHQLAHNGKDINHLNSQSCHYTTATSAANDNSVHYLNYPHEDSIYIPDYMMAMGTKVSNKIRDTSNNSADSNELFENVLMSKRSNFFNQQLNGKHNLLSRPRPKSSLDTPFISSGVNQHQHQHQHHYHHPSLSISTSTSTSNNGRYLSANLNSTNNQAVLATETLTPNSQNHPLLSFSSNSSSHFPLTQDQSSHQTSNNKFLNSPSSVKNQSLLSNHNINLFDYKKQVPTYYSYSSPYHNAHNHKAYLYSENSIYASDQSVAFNRSSDLTVLPTVSAETSNVNSFNSPRQADSIEAKVSIASGGYTSSKKGGANIMINCPTDSNSTLCTSSPASNQSDKSRTPKAQQQQQVVERNSWIPSQPYKSLIQVRQISSTKSDQSQIVGEINGQQTLSSISTNNQLNSEIEEDPQAKTMETDSSFSNSKGPTKFFVSNRAQANESEDKLNSPTTISVVHENTSTII